MAFSPQSGVPGSMPGGRGKTGDHVVVKTIMTIMATLFFLSVNSIGYCDNGRTYTATVDLIKDLLPGISSDVRNESYGYIRFNKCILDYQVSGTYPVGTPYNIAFSNIDFSTLDYQASKTGADSSHYIILNFNKPFDQKQYSDQRKVSTVVIDAASHGQAQTLFKAFLHLGELCGAGKNPG